VEDRSVNASYVAGGVAAGIAVISVAFMIFHFARRPRSEQGGDGAVKGGFEPEAEDLLPDTS
jgi:hypothetical protein